MGSIISSAVPDWPRFLGDCSASGVLRYLPEDFRVREESSVEPFGSGNHLWLEISKRNTNTDWAARALSNVAGCKARDVGYAGMKDRRAVTSQWFSLPLESGADENWESWVIDGVTILQGIRHNRKLKRGAIAANHFKLKVRDIAGDPGDVESRLVTIRDSGVPNYFGPQRFGHGGQNVRHAIHWLTGANANKRRMPRHRRSIYLSSLRSFVFNRILAHRVLGGTWNVLLDGELAMLSGSHSVFECVLPDEELEQRCQRFDIHPSGLLAGEGGSRPSGDAAAVEDLIEGEYRAVIEGLASLRVSAARRSLRVLPSDLQWSLADNTLELGFSLPAGSYATSVMREVLNCTDYRPPADDATTPDTKMN